MRRKILDSDALETAHARVGCHRGSFSLIVGLWSLFSGYDFSPCSAAPAPTPILNQVRRLNASDAKPGDELGHSVAIGNGMALIGAPLVDDAGNQSGAAYLFDIESGQQLYKLRASDSSTDDRFGWSVAIGNGVALVGASEDDAFGFDSGAAYLFDISSGNELLKLHASDATELDRFGSSVAITEQSALVGAYRHAPGVGPGAAYVFDLDGHELFKLSASDGAWHDRFGWSVAASGNIALVGAYGDDDGGNDSGSAYVFDLTTGAELFKLTAADAAADDQFGYSIGVSGSLGIVGAPFDSDNGRFSGAAYLFDVTTGQQLLKLTASDAAADDYFGWSVAISGNIAVVGAPRVDDAGFNAGVAYVFDAVTGRELFKLAASDAMGFDLVGAAVAISGNTGLLGAYSDFFGNNSGSAYVFSQLPEPACGQLLMISAFGLGFRRFARRNGRFNHSGSPAD